MNTRNRKLAMAAILAAASFTAMAARAEDQSAWFDQQRQITDGYYPQYTAKDTSKDAPDNSPQAIAFKHQLAAGSSVDTYELNGKASAPTQTATKESPAFESFETQIGAGEGVATYTPAEHSGS